MYTSGRASSSFQRCAKPTDPAAPPALPIVAFWSFACRAVSKNSALSTKLIGSRACQPWLATTTTRPGDRAQGRGNCWPDLGHDTRGFGAHAATLSRRSLSAGCRTGGLCHPAAEVGRRGASSEIKNGRPRPLASAARSCTAPSVLRRRRSKAAVRGGACPPSPLEPDDAAGRSATLARRAAGPRAFAARYRSEWCLLCLRS